jgi:hypothetical protein
MDLQPRRHVPSRSDHPRRDDDARTTTGASHPAKDRRLTLHSRLKGWRAVLAASAVSVILGALSVAPAAAITDGTPTAEGDYPYVGLMTAHAADGDYLWRCTGTLLSPTVFVTAGHCTDGAAYAVVYFGVGPIIPDPDFTLDTRSCVGISGYPCGDGITGEVFTHPQFDPDAFYLYDLGVVVLDEPVVLGEYAQLPELNALDGLRVGTRFTSVGYGLQKAFPDAAARKDVAVRQQRVAHPRLLQMDTGSTGDYSILLSNNAHTGGTCFGDSGGPNFLGDTTTLAGVTSYGKNWTCGGTGGVYRLDQADDLPWLATFLD